MIGQSHPHRLAVARLRDLEQRPVALLRGLRTHDSFFAVHHPYVALSGLPELRHDLLEALRRRRTHQSTVELIMEMPELIGVSVRLDHDVELALELTQILVC